VNAVLRRTVPYALSTPAVTAAATVLSAAGVLAGPAATAVLGGMLLGLVLPGLALTWLIFRYRTLTAVERTVLAPALSLAVLIISGLILSVAGFPLDRMSWTLAAAGTTLAVLALKAVPERVWQGEEDDEAEPADARTEIIPVVRGGAPPPAPAARRPLPGPFAPWSPKQKVTAVQLVRQLTPMVLVVAILAGAGYLSYISSDHSYDVTVTTLSAAPPAAADGSGQRVVALSASGLVAADGPYTVLVTDPGGTRLAERTVPVAESGRWQANVRLPAADRLTVGLFRAGDTSAYRTLYIAAEE
jgi:hypothetical protein